MAQTSDNSLITRGFMVSFMKRLKMLFAPKSHSDDLSIHVTSEEKSVLDITKGTYSFTISNPNTSTADYTTTSSGTQVINGVTFTKVAITLAKNDGNFIIRLEGDYIITSVSTSQSSGFLNGSRLTLITYNHFYESFSMFSNSNGEGVYKVSPESTTDETITSTTWNILRSKTVEEYVYYYGWYSKHYTKVLTTDTVITTSTDNIYQILPPSSYAVKTALGSYLPLSAGSSKQLTGDLYNPHNTILGPSSALAIRGNISSGTYNRVALNTAGIFMKDDAYKGSISINSTGNIDINDASGNNNIHITRDGNITAATTIWAKVNLKSRLIQLAPAEGEGPAYLDFYRPGDTDPSGRFICRTQNSIVLENCNFYSSKYKALAGDTYTLTTTDGIAGVCGSGTLVLPSLTDTDSYTNTSLIGRNIWVDGNQGVITVNFTSSTGSASITVGRGQGAMFVMNHSHTWDLLTPGFLIKKTVSGSQTYSLTQTDGLGMIEGTSTNTTAITLPLAAGWEGRRVIVSAHSGSLAVKHYYRKDDGTTTSTTKTITSGSFTEYIFINGAWARTAGKSL